MKGINEIKLYLGSGNSLSVQVAKDILPSTEVDRDALFHVLIEQQKELATLKATTPVVTERSEPKASTSTTQSEEAEAPLNTAGATSPEIAVGAPLMAAGVATPSNTAGAKTPSTTSDGNTGNTEKPESAKLCPVMWGKSPCPGAECNRVHLRWCAKPQCAINEAAKKECKLWHGHFRVALQKERLKKKKIAEQRAANAEQREFNEWKKQRSQGNGKTPSGRGIQDNFQKRKETKTHKGDTQKQVHKHVQSNRKGEKKGWSQPVHRPRPLSLGDYFPPLPTPQKKQAWAKPATRTVAPVALGSEDAKLQLQQFLQGLQALLQEC